MIGAIDELPNAASYLQASVSEQATGDELLSLAAESYEHAASSLSSVNIRGTDTQHAAETADELNELARRLRGEPETEPEGTVTDQNRGTDQP